MPFSIVRWFDDSEYEGAIDQFLEKFDAGTLDGTADFGLFIRAMIQARKQSEESDDEDKKELSEIMKDDIEEYECLVYFFEVRGTEEKIIQVLTPDVNKSGIWEGDYDEVPSEIDGMAVKNVSYMEATPDTWLQGMKGNPNMDAQFFAGDLTVKGTMKLVTKTREWIYSFMDFIGRGND